MSKQELIKRISESKNNIEKQINHSQLAFQAIKYIGDLNPVVRDDLVYNYLEMVILNNLLSIEDIKKVLSICIVNLNDFGKDTSIFKRSFSLLVIATIIYRHNQIPFLNEKEIQELFQTVIIYYNNDKNVKGFDEKYGWAHQAAHGADVLKQLSMKNNLDKKRALLILDAIFMKINIDYYNYQHNEDDRMARVLEVLISRKVLSEEDIKTWFNSFKLSDQFSLQQLTQKLNVRNFLRSLYFRLIKNEEHNDLTKTLLTVLNRL